MLRRPLLRLLAALCCAAAVPAVAGGEVAPAPPGAAADVTAAGDPMPLFERNLGQDAPQVRFRGWVGGALVHLLPGGVAITLPGPDATPPKIEQQMDGLVPVARRWRGGPGRVATVHVDFVGGAADPPVRGGERAPTVVHYLRGDDPAGWQRDVPLHHDVTYGGVWPGVDVRYDAPAGRLKATYLVAAGADPARIRLRHRGASVTPARDGSLRIDPPGAVPALVEAPPVAWQGEGRSRRPVAARWVRHRDGSVGFALGRYDRGHPLVIDPEVRWTVRLPQAVMAASVLSAVRVVPGSGDLVVGGAVEDFYYWPAPRYRGIDAFVARMSGDGTRIRWITIFGGSGHEDVDELDVDRAGRIAFGGSTDSADFPVRNAIGDAEDRPPEGYPTGDGVAGVLTADGRGLLFSTYLASNGVDFVIGVRFLPGGDVAVAGPSNASLLFDDHLRPTPGAYAGGFVARAFVARFAPDGDLRYLSVFGPNAPVGREREQRGMGDGVLTFSLEVDPAGELVLLYAADTPYVPIVTPGAAQRHLRGWADWYVMRFAADGSRPLGGTYLGGRLNDQPRDLALDARGDVYVAGWVPSPDFPVRAPDVTPCDPLDPNSDWDAAVARIDASLRRLIYARCIGSGGTEISSALTVDRDRTVVFVGGTTSGDFPAYRAWQPSATGSTIDFFVVGVRPDGRVLFSSVLGSSNFEDDQRSQPWLDVTVDPRGGAAYVVHGTPGADFPGASPASERYLRGVPFSQSFVTRIAYW